MDSEELVEPLRAQLPPHLQAKAPLLAEMVAGLVDGTISPEAAREWVKGLGEAGQELARSLTGREVPGGQSVVRFGDRMQVGALTIGQAAGRDIIEVNVFAPPSAALLDLVGPARHRVKALIEDYQAVFGGRQDQLRALDSFIGQGARRFLLLYEPTGLGKTAVLIRWIGLVQEAGGWDVVFIPISRRYQTATADVVLGMAANALARLHGDRLEGQSLSPEQLRPYVRDHLGREPPKGHRLLVILDGLDEAVGWEVRQDLFPRTLPPNVWVVASARQAAGRSRQMWVRDLGWHPGEVLELPLPPLERRDVSDVVHQLGLALVPDPDVDLIGVLTQVSQGDPLTIRVLAEDLASGAVTPKGLSIRPPGLEAYLQEWLEEIRGAKDEGGKKAVSNLLGLLAMAEGPLSGEDINALDPRVFADPDGLRETVKAVARFVIGDGSEERGYVFSHPRLREWYRDHSIWDADRDTLQRAFLEWGKAYMAMPTKLSSYLRRFWLTHLAQAGQWELATQVVTEIVPVEGRHRQPWAEARFAVEKSYSGYLGDLDLVWRWAEQERHALGLRCALISASIRSLSSNLPPELIVGLVAEGTPDGRWSTQAALEHISQMPSPDNQAAAMKALAELSSLPTDNGLEVARGIYEEAAQAEALASIAELLPDEEQRSVYHEAFGVALKVLPDGPRARALAALAPGLPSELVPEALEAIGAMDPFIRAPVLVGLAPKLPREKRTSVYQEALATPMLMYEPSWRLQAWIGLATCLPEHAFLSQEEAARDRLDQPLFLAASATYPPKEQQLQRYAEALLALKDMSDSWRADALVAMAPNLPQELIPPAFQAAQDLDPGWGRGGALVAIAGRLPEELLPQALKAAREIPERERARPLAALARYLPEPQPLYQEALLAAQAIWDHRERALAISALAARSHEDVQPNLFQEALQAARRDGSGWIAGLLASIAERLPGALQFDVYAEALSAVQDPTELSYLAACNLPMSLVQGALDKARRDGNIEAMAMLAGRLPEDLQPELYREAFAAATQIPDEGTRAIAIGALATGMPAILLPEALRVAGKMSDEWKTSLLADLAPRFPDEQQQKLCKEALEAIKNIEFGKGGALARLAPILPDDLVVEAFEMTADFPEGERALGRAALVHRLPAETREAVYDEALQSSGRFIWHVGADTLFLVASQLPQKLVRHALRIACDIPDEGPRESVLRSLAPGLLREARDGDDDRAPNQDLWPWTVRRISSYGRPGMLRSLLALDACLAGLLPSVQEFEDIAKSILDCARAWP